jgi:hypothetical protein
MKKEDVLKYVLENTHREKLNEVSTRQVALKFNVTVNKAYVILKGLAKEKKIEHLDPVNGDNFSCAGWIRLTDN